ncbi:Exocyst complex component 5 [Dissostichus eleginoides]|uniref:Exocyst complex component 5 n=1 Tax=Dissostichus eleginoides TaxID=100907 RepID=A0AAD9FD10_DISEL|nr:Exocyst complex component 5 [Dissostichus eleginoides]
MATTAQLFEEPFDADEYIERLAWRTPGGGSKGGAEAFDPKRLLEEFENHIEELKQLDEKIQRRWRSSSISVTARPRNLPTKCKTCREATRWPSSISRSSMSISAMWRPRFVTLATSWRG